MASVVLSTPRPSSYIAPRMTCESMTCASSDHIQAGAVATAREAKGDDRGRCRPWTPHAERRLVSSDRGSAPAALTLDAWPKSCSQMSKIAGRGARSNGRHHFAAGAKTTEQGWSVHHAGPASTTSRAAAANSSRHACSRGRPDIQARRVRPRPARRRQRSRRARAAGWPPARRRRGMASASDALPELDPRPAGIGPTLFHFSVA